MQIACPRESRPQTLPLPQNKLQHSFCLFSLDHVGAHKQRRLLEGSVWPKGTRLCGSDVVESPSAALIGPIRVEMMRRFRKRGKWVPLASGVLYPPYLVRFQNTGPLRHRFPIRAITKHLAHGITCGGVDSVGKIS